jgi:hypothetical protein
VRINIPLLPIHIDVRWRPLPPLRLRFTVLGLMLMVGITGLFFSFVAESVRLNRLGSYHAEQRSNLAKSRHAGPRTGTRLGATALEDWHAKTSDKYHAAGNRIGSRLVATLMAFGALGMVALLCRVLARE